MGDQPTPTFRCNLKIQNITLPQDVNDKIKVLDNLIKDLKYAEAETVYKIEIKNYNTEDDEYVIAKFNKLYAEILKEKDFNIEEMDSLLMQCLSTFQKFNKTFNKIASS